MPTNRILVWLARLIECVQVWSLLYLQKFEHMLVKCMIAKTPILIVDDWRSRSGKDFIAHRFPIGDRWLVGSLFVVLMVDGHLTW
jgi:hypothetical protein